MLNNKSILKVAGLAAAAALVSLVVAPKADAQSVTFPVTSNSFNTTGALPGTISLELPEFNNTSGTYAGDTLTGVSITLSGSLVTTSASLTNTSPGSETIKANGTGITTDDFEYDGSTADFGSGVEGNGVSLLSSSVTLASLASNTVVAAGGTLNLTLGSGFSNSVTITETDLSAYLGSGDITITPYDSISTTANVIGGGTTNFSSVTEATGSATITYTYTVPATVPEPMTTLGSVAALGLGVAMRRMKLKVAK
jgi:hypothetical protein